MQEDGGSASQPLERLIYSACKRGQWTMPYMSKYFAFKYPSGSKLGGYAEMSLWPGSLDRGLGRDCLNAALKLAEEKHGLKLEGFNINGLPDERKLNLYFFDPKTAPQFSKFKNQCVYVGFKHIILCDAGFLAQFSEIPLIEKKLDGYLEPGAHFSTLLDKRQPYIVNFTLHGLGASHHTMMWALLHEIGHMANAHQPLSQVQRIFRAHQSKIRAQEMENEADEFAVAALQSYTDGGLGLVVGGVQNVTTGLIAAALNAPNGMLPVRLAEIEDPIPVTRSNGTHPPMIIRLLDAMVVFEKTFPDFSQLDNPTFKRLRSQIILRP